MYLAKVQLTPKPAANDWHGSTKMDVMQLGFAELASIHVGKYMEIKIGKYTLKASKEVKA